MRLFDRVYGIMGAMPTTRNSDRLLLIEVWRGQGLELTPEQEQKFMTVASAESVTRARRKIQETEYKPTERVQAARAALADEYAQRAVKSHKQAQSWQDVAEQAGW